MDYVIIARVTTALPQERFVRVLQLAFDGGAAGSFDTRPIVNGYEVVFFRESEEPESGIPETVEQLAQEIEGCDLLVEDYGEADLLDEVAAQIRATGWKALPFGRDAHEEPANAGG